MSYVKELARRFWRRIRSSDVVDWLFGLLFLVVGIGITIGVYAWINQEPEKFNAISYAVPALIVDSTNSAPVVDEMNLPVPSIRVGDEVPLRLTRYMTCDSIGCPIGSIPVSITVRWQELTLNSISGREDTERGLSVLALEDFETQLIEGEDYSIGNFSTHISQLRSFAFPEEVRTYIKANDLEISVWRIEGTTIPGVGDADPVTWYTEPIHIYNPPEE